jgi:wyosine [tRNA(Phe)-imidazoG37] synthetase (radical SAM superfamily)
VDEVNAFEYPQPIDYLTFSGRGEPTLAKNLGEMIRALRSCRQEKIAVITNSTLLPDPQVRADLFLADCVLAKLDACDAHICGAVGAPCADFRFDKMIESMRIFKKEFHGKFALQIMFVKENKGCAADIAALARTIGADEIELNTPLRPCASVALTPEEMNEIKDRFDGLPVTMVYERQRRTAQALDREQTKKRHGQYTDS